MDARQGKVSVIINTDGRAASLQVCLESLRYVRYPAFEVVVVAGPTNDGTWELCQSMGASIVYGRCPVRNLSKSRNIGIGLASGEILAFLDDDSIPEPEWLDDILPAFDNREVAVAGGFLYDHTGKGYQWQYGTSNRMGSVNQCWDRTSPEFNFPQSSDFPFVMANSAFRHSTVADIGGFDEEFDYFLDENDLIVRVVDAGYVVKQLNHASIHHKFMPSHIRNTSKILTSWYSIIKNKAYFAMMHGKDYFTMQEILDEVGKFVQHQRDQVHWAVSEGLLLPGEAERFEREADMALRHGLTRGFSGQRRLADATILRGRSAFTPFPKFCYPQGQPCCILVSSSWPPEPANDTVQNVMGLARKLAAWGVQVHVLTAGSGHDRVDFEGGVWVRRIVVRHGDFSRTMLAEAREVAARRRVDIVYVPPSVATLAAAFAESEFAVAYSADFLRTLPKAVPPDAAGTVRG